MNQRFGLAGSMALVAATALSAGQAPPPATQAPTFKTEIEYVEVDALVTDAEGRFVRDLTKDDFQVFEDGKPQTISTFSLVDIPIERGERPLFAAAPIEPDVRTNERPFDGRVYVLILDAWHTYALRSQRVKIAARRFIERNLGVNDAMAVVHTGGRSSAAQEFTSNKRLLIASVDQFMGRKLESATVARNADRFRLLDTPAGDLYFGDTLEMERASHARSTLRAIKNTAEWLSALRGRRKSIIFMSEGFDYDSTDAIRQFNEPTSAALGIIDDIRETIAATARSNVSIYAIDPRGLTDVGDLSIGIRGYTERQAVGRGLRTELRASQDNLRALAEGTNGYAAVNSNDFAGAFDRIVRDNSSYYMMAYYPPSVRRDGRFHRIEVRVSRPGLTVRARRGYVAPKGTAAPRKPARSNGGASPLVVEALNSPLPVSGLTMHVFTASFKGTAPNASVLLGVELSARDLSLATGGKVELSYFASDVSGKTRGGQTDNLTLNLRPETKARVEQEGALRILNRLDLKPGRYTLRVAAHDKVGGKVGSISYDLEIPDFYKLPFSMSGLALTSLSGAAMVTARPDEGLRSVLPAPPMARRTFQRNDEIALFAEIYERSGTAPHAVDIVTTVRSDEGAIVFKHEEERSSSELQGQSGGFGYQARVPLSDLAPGLYVLAVEARSRLGDHPTVTRQVQFKVTPEMLLLSR